MAARRGWWACTASVLCNRLSVRSRACTVQSSRPILISTTMEIWTIEVPRGMGQPPLEMHLIRLAPRGARWMLFMEVRYAQRRHGLHAGRR